MRLVFGARPLPTIAAGAEGRIGIGYRTFQFDLASIPQAGGDGPGEGLERVTKFSLGARF